MADPYPHVRSEFSGAQFSTCRCGNSVVCWPDTTAVPPGTWGANCHAALREALAASDAKIDLLTRRVAQLDDDHKFEQECARRAARERDDAQKAVSVLQEAVDIHVQNHLAQQVEIGRLTSALGHWTDTVARLRIALRDGHGIVSDHLPGYSVWLDATEAVLSEPQPNEVDGE